MFDESELWTEDEPYESGDDGLYDVEAVGDEYEAIRPLLAEGWRNADPEQIEALLENVTRSMTREEAENFWSTISNIGRSIAPIAGQVVGVAAPLLGGAIGGPVGASLGGTLGSLAGGALSSLGGRPATPLRAPAVASPIRAPLPVAGALATAAPTLSLAPAPSATTAATSASSQLLSFLQNPQLLQSLLQQLLGGAGGGAVPVGSAGAAAPFGAFMNALSVLAGRAAAEAESESTDSSYLFGANGELIADPHSPDERAAALLEHLRT
jgi:hypothetical protein